MIVDYALGINVVSNFNSVDEVVFCGFGEPLLRLDTVIEVSKKLKQMGYKIRIDTDGLASLVYEENIPARLKGFVDAISISLNAPDAATYTTVCPSRYGEKSYQAVKEFIKEARQLIPEVTASVVGLPDLDIEKCRQVIEDELQVKFRLRPYNEVG